MRVPVLVVLPSQEPLQESALALREARAPRIPLEAAYAPAGVEIDLSVPAVPVGTGRPDTLMETLAPAASERFVVRAFVEAETPEQIPTESEGRPIFADPKIASFLTCGGDPPVGDAGLVAKKLSVATLAAAGLDGDRVAVAIMDSGINLAHLRSVLGRMPRADATNSWTAPGNPTAPFRHPVDHGTMCAFDALIAAPQATLLDFPVLSGSAPGANITGQTLSVALLAYSQLIASWAVGFAVGGTSGYSGLVVNNSWGIFHPSWDFPPGHPGRYSDNPNHPFSQIVGVLARSGADILFAAGNCGAECSDFRCQGRTTDTIVGANALADVLTLAGCDTTDARVGYSSQGPAIAGMFREKPDVTTYTHFDGSEAFGKGTADSGTSAACPVAAGVVAALRTKVSHANTPPANLFAQLRLTARSVAPNPPGWNGDYGHGILDPIAAGQSLGVLP